MKNRKLISLFTLSDPETGEVIQEHTKMLNPPKYIRFPKDFTKIYWRAGNSMNNIDLGYYVKLTDYVEYSTNKLVYRHVGRTPKSLLHKDMADILDVSKRTVTTFMGKMSDIKSILRIDSNYYINPSFASRSRGIDFGIIMKMMEIDPFIFQFIDENQQSLIEKFNLLP